MNRPYPRNHNGGRVTLEERLTALENRLSATEERLATAEDRLAILQLVATYGPAVDSGTADVTAELWVEEGVYDTFPQVFDGRAQIAAMVNGERHQTLIHAGAAHLLGIPHITIEGDSAVVTNYSQLVRSDPESRVFTTVRTGVNRWELRREHGQDWRIVHRSNRQLDGDSESRDLLARAVAAKP